MGERTQSEPTSSLSFAENICRTCLAKITPHNSISIFSEKESICGKSVRRMLEEFACTLINPLEKLPKNICLKCSDRLKNLTSFKKTMESADKTLRTNLRMAEYELNKYRRLMDESETKSLEVFLNNACGSIREIVDEYETSNTLRYTGNSSNGNTKESTITTPSINNNNVESCTGSIGTDKNSVVKKPFSGRDFIESFLSQQSEKNESKSCPRPKIDKNHLVCDVTNKRPKRKRENQTVVMNEVSNLEGDTPPQIHIDNNDMVKTSPESEVIEISDSPLASPTSHNDQEDDKDIQMSYNIKEEEVCVKGEFGITCEDNSITYEENDTFSVRRDVVKPKMKGRMKGWREKTKQNNEEKWQEHLENDKNRNRINRAKQNDKLKSNNALLLEKRMKDRERQALCRRKKERENVSHVRF